MVLGWTEQGSGCHSKENQHLHEVEKVVEQQHQAKMKDTRARKEKMGTTLGGSSPSQSRVAEIYSQIQEPNVGQLPAEPSRS